MIEDLRAVKAVLEEIRTAMVNLIETGKTHMIYVGSTGLSEEEQVEVLETLGRGSITIAYTETDQPVEWYESNFHGVWIGTYKNQRDEASLYTIEVCFYPEVVSSYKEDIQDSINELLEWVDAADL